MNKVLREEAHVWGMCSVKSLFLDVCQRKVSVTRGCVAVSFLLVSSISQSYKIIQISAVATSGGSVLLSGKE